MPEIRSSQHRCRPAPWRLDQSEVRLSRRRRWRPGPGHLVLRCIGAHQEDAPPRKARSPFCPEAPAYRKHNGVLACELRVDGGIVVSCYLRSGHSDERVSLYRPACTKCSPLMGQPVRVFWISIPLAWCSLLCDLGTSASPSCHPSGSRTFCFLCGPFSCLIPACASRGSLAFFLTDSPMCFLRFWPVLASIGAPKKQIGGSGLLALCSSLGLPPVVGDYASTCHLSLGLWQGLHRSYCLLCRGAGTLVFCYFDAPPHIGIGCEREILVSVSLRQEPQPLPAFNSPFPQRRVADCHYHS